MYDSVGSYLGFSDIRVCTSVPAMDPSLSEHVGWDVYRMNVIMISCECEGERMWRDLILISSARI